MDTLTLGAYILVWPLISLAVLALIVSATLRDVRKARRNNQELI